MSDDTAQPTSSFPSDMTWRQLEVVYGLVGFSEPPTARALELSLGDDGGQVIREGGETTLLVPMRALPEVMQLHPSARAERDLIGFRFEAPMGWEVVGFLALVTARLAEAGVPVCALCTYSRDYVLIAEPYATEARRVLGELFLEAT